MKFLKRMAAVVLSLSLLLLTACNTGEGSKPDSEKINVNIATLKGPTGIGMVNLMELAKEGEAPDNYSFTLAGAADEITGKLTSGEVDIAAVPTNLAATLYNKTGGKVRIIAVNTLGVLYVVENGDTVKSVDDLKGKTVSATGQAAVPEYAFNYILEQNGMKAGTDVTVDYLSEHSELAAQLIAGKVNLAVLPEPFVTQVTAKNPDVRVALDLAEEWNTASDEQSDLVMGCLVVRTEFAEEHKAELDAFLDAYKQSAEAAVKDVEKTAQLTGEYDIMDAAVAEKAIPKCNIVYMDGTEMKESTGAFLKVLFEAQPKSVGGKLPDDGFYYQK